ncbi:dTMP kinase [Bacillus marinisedimentorum]|uniref:dTMP kinase n=1 Tax=Bacillus marinisedimentorum TaxID=1821260 RepID=UPI000872CD01|nr:thymidylate kinase [Bacillus marinisedimentorum]
MKDLLNLIEKSSFKDDFLVNPGDLSEKSLYKLLKWYDGNIYNMSEARVNNAVNILAWCYTNADELDYLPRDLRNKYIRDASKKYQISKEKLVNLYSSHTSLIFPDGNQTTIIAFEGIDGSGKTVQMSLLENRLKKDKKGVASKSFPIYESFFGSHIGKFLSGMGTFDANKVDPKSMSLWYALDRWKAFENFNFTQYDYLLLNRFTLSSAVYQSARVEPNQRFEFVNWIFDLEHSQLGLPVPDLYIVLDLNEETSKKNISTKGFRQYVGEKADVYEDSEVIISNARHIYHELAKKHKNILIIDCLDENHNMKSPEEINKLVMKVIENGKY